MVDEFRTIRDNLFKVLTGKDRDPSARDDDEDGSVGGFAGLDAGAAKALISAIFARAGKGKDEVVQIVAREIGVAVAAMLREPLALLAKNQKLQISFEFVPKDSTTDGAKDEPAALTPKAGHPKRPRTPTKRSSKRPKSDIGG